VSQHGRLARILRVERDAKQRRRIGATDLVRIRSAADGQTTKIEAAVPLALRYDAAGRLREATRGGQMVGRYQYDPFGRRIRKETAQGATWFQYSDEGVAAEYAANGALQRIYGYLPGERWGRTPLWQARADGTGWQVYTYHVDLAGLPVRMTDRSGAVVWSLRSDAFGASEIIEAQAGVDNPLRYPGQYRDTETGINYNWHRSYQPATGRYLEWDPMRQYGDPNPYSYANANPFRFIDPEGLLSKAHCDCDKDTKQGALWLGGSGAFTGMVGPVGAVLGLGVVQNQFTGEVCITFKYCLRFGIGAGVSAGVGADAEWGNWCGKDMDGGTSCELSISGVAVGGLRGRVKMRHLPDAAIGGVCGDPSGSADLGGLDPKYFPKGLGAAAAAGAEASIALTLCKTQVIKCFNSPCACNR
jgi:RHS repeat-associated protein